MPQPHYIGSPEDSGEWPVLREPRETKGSYLAKRAAIFAVLWALLAGAILLVAMLAGCAAQPRPQAWCADFEVRYANGQVITSGHAGSVDSGANESDSPVESKAARGNGASAQNTSGDKR